MGTICEGVNQEGSHHIRNSSKQTPHPYYAVPTNLTISPPVSNEYIANILNHQPLQVPSWYDSSECTALEPYYLIKHFDLYYCGEWKNGMPHGKGQVVTKDHQYFRGYFTEGVANGPQCLFLIEKQTYYLGPVLNNQRSGQGKFLDGGYSYEGHWAQNLPHGFGQQNYPNGDCYKGDFKHGMKDGQGQYTWNEKGRKAEFDNYKGQFKNNEMEGIGRLMMRSEVIWEGNFYCDQSLQISNGKCLAKDKVVHGEFRNGQPISPFRLSSEGKNHEITFKNNMIYGKGEQNDNHYIFQNKILRYYSMENNDPQPIKKIIRAVQEGYSEATKHSEALKKIKESLPQYDCTFWKQGQKLSGIAIVPICGKMVKVCKKNSSE